MVHSKSGAWLLMALIALAMAGLAPAVRADEQLLLKRGALAPDKAFIVDFVKKHYEDAKTDPNSLFVGRHDINGDGQPELFVYVYDFGWCGVVGCPTVVFERKNGQWTSLAELTVTQDGYVNMVVYARKEPGLKYLTLYSGYYAYRWNEHDHDYDVLCIRDCDHTEGNEALKEFFRNHPEIFKTPELKTSAPGKGAQ